MFFNGLGLGRLHHLKSTSHNEMMTFYHQMFFYVFTSMLHLLDESLPNI
jgi:hypothetical protein